VIGYVHRRKYGKRLPPGFMFRKRHTAARQALIRKAGRYRRRWKQRATNAEGPR
jgi:hypothetical protein